jgi:hypothetical protein
MLRIVIGVIVSFVAMSIVVFSLSIAPWYLFGVDTVFQPSRFDTTPAVTVYAVLVGALGAVGAGWLCARLTQSQGAVIALAVLCFLAGSGNAVGQRKKPAPGPRPPGLSVGQAMTQRKEPAWFTFLMPCIGVLGVLIGGRRA